MIECFEGTLGGGKSYHAVKRALDYLAVGGRVFSNIELVQSECESFVADRYGLSLQWSEQYRYLNASDIARLHEVVKGGDKDCPVLCILDEIHLYHNSRDWANASRGLLQWLTQSRKLFVDIICITQHRNNLDKQWIRLMGRYWRFRDMRKWKMPGIGLRIPFVQALAVELDQDGKTVIQKTFERFDNRIFRCYSSEQIFDGVSAGFAGSGLKRLKLDKTKKGLSMKGYIWIAVMVAGLSLLGVFLYRSLNRSPFKHDSPSASVGEDMEKSPVRHKRSSPSESDSPLPESFFSPPEYVACDGWTGRDGFIVGGYSSKYRLVFRGEPDMLEDGLPVYAYRRGTLAY